MIRTPEFWKLFAASLAIALGSAGVPYLTDRNDVFLVLKLVVPLCLVWTALFAVGLWQFRWRGFWLLLGAPIAYWWPLAFAMVAVTCARNVRACP